MRLRLRPVELPQASVHSPCHADLCQRQLYEAVLCEKDAVTPQAHADTRLWHTAEHYVAATRLQWLDAWQHCIDAFFETAAPSELNAASADSLSAAMREARA